VRARPAFARRLPPVRRLIVELASGAESMMLVRGVIAHAARDAIVYQYAFHQFVDDRLAADDSRPYRLPEEQDLRDALLCWASPARHREMCEARPS
jgi:hypothetical protein